MSIRGYLRNTLPRPIVRPWALAAPVLVLVICLPLLRPLRHPTEVSEDEALRLATVHALVHTGSLALNDPVSRSIDPARLIEKNGCVYADQPPVMAVLLSGPAWAMRRLGIAQDESGALVAYVLTVLGVTLPVAGAAGLLHRMGRLFELPRPWRAALATAIVFASGLISYAVVLNPHAPAAVLILCAVACLIHVSITKLPRRGVSWVLISGICAAGAATLDPPAGIIALLLVFAIAAMRFPIHYRLAGIALYLAGAALPVLLHASWAWPIKHEVIPGWKASPVIGSLNSRTRSSDAALLASARESVKSVLPELDADDVIAPPSRWVAVGRYLEWLFDAMFGAHGLLSHFPVLLVGLSGVGAVMHRHWPSFVKFLAAATVLGAVLIVTVYCAPLSDFAGSGGAMFASRWFIVFLPLLLFWSGAWLRRNHSPTSWVTAALLLVFSIGVSLIGMTQPYPREGFERYTAGEALHRLVQSPPKDALAGG
jgi:hypothetical protein